MLLCSMRRSESNKEQQRTNKQLYIARSIQSKRRIISMFIWKLLVLFTYKKNPQVFERLSLYPWLRIISWYVALSRRLDWMEFSTKFTKSLKNSNVNSRISYIYINIRNVCLFKKFQFGKISSIYILSRSHSESNINRILYVCSVYKWIMSMPNSHSFSIQLMITYGQLINVYGETQKFSSIIHNIYTHTRAIQYKLHYWVKETKKKPQLAKYELFISQR